MTVLIYVDTSKQVGDKDHLKVFATRPLRKRGFRRMTRKASRSSMRCWGEAEQFLPRRTKIVKIIFIGRLANRQACIHQRSTKMRGVASKYE